MTPKPTKQPRNEPEINSETLAVLMRLDSAVKGMTLQEAHNARWTTPIVESAVNMGWAWRKPAKAKPGDPPWRYTITDEGRAIVRKLTEYLKELATTPQR